MMECYDRSKRSILFIIGPKLLFPIMEHPKTSIPSSNLKQEETGVEIFQMRFSGPVVERLEQLELNEFFFHVT